MIRENHICLYMYILFLYISNFITRQTCDCGKMVCCSVMQCDAVCRSVLQSVAVCIPPHNKHLTLKTLRGAVCWSVLQCADLCRRVLHCVAECCSVHSITHRTFDAQNTAWCSLCSALKCVALCCSVLQCVAVCIPSHIKHLTLKRLRGAVCWSVLQCVALCRSVLQCVAVCCSVHFITRRIFDSQNTLACHKLSTSHITYMVYILRHITNIWMSYATHISHVTRSNDTCHTSQRAISHTHSIYHTHTSEFRRSLAHSYWMAVSSRLFKNICLFCRIWSLL